ncbi:MAG: 50S ribosomal protein L29 [Candidatus Paceibacterota bacterium]|jgi:ribosomal protein L29
MSEITNKTIKELEKEIEDKRVALRSFRFGFASSKVKNVREGRVLKRDIARLLTQAKVLAKKS